ncbi:hypothetical protein [Halodesulfovibrio sp. MK-HDV]|jgi:hypothetical protein|uniref:hypothetical protein n=1 Tax=Halodesulfovibrio sp. MK-HDV TaxID=2599925 RepID=UPI00136C5A19|nr:hypothetical protein [Halodesulfovibrio sp. MK-HDV]KAF1075170.1 hypothetical protein MKHDV_02213 [Halodesulfovibrio sp. MK-HDV]
MSLVNSLLSKPVDMTQLQKTAQAMQKKSAGGVSNLFVNQQTDHSKYIRASIESSRAVHKALDNKMSSMTSLLQAQMSFEESGQAENSASYHGPLDLSYSRRARIGARAGQLLNRDQSKEVRRSNDAVTDRDRAAESSERPTEVVHGVAASLTRISSASGSHRASAKPQAKISIRV